VEVQTRKYVEGVAEELEVPIKPLPFAYVCALIQMGTATGKTLLDTVLPITGCPPAEEPAAERNLVSSEPAPFPGTLPFQSFTPSPTMNTRAPRARLSCTTATLSSGSSAARISSMPG
jgi:hypothetical protein